MYRIFEVPSGKICVLSNRAIRAPKATFRWLLCYQRNVRFADEMRIRGILQPEYLFRPRRIASRVFRRHLPSSATVRLSWGLDLEVNPRELVGQRIYYTGVFDLVLTEVIWRLVDSGDSVIDVGANIGYITSVLAVRAGPTGRVRAFEPHPDIFERLRANISQWPMQRLAMINAIASGVSDKSGAGLLAIPSTFRENHGLASLATTSLPDVSHEVPVSLTRLDDAIAPGERIRLLKVDVEGHELAVLQGASRLLSDGTVTTVLFEEHSRYPTSVTEYLHSKGYTVYALGRDLWGPRIWHAREGEVPPFANYMATTMSPTEVEHRMRPRGWHVL
jgi:FkbM family methyltransferase